GGFWLGSIVKYVASARQVTAGGRFLTVKDCEVNLACKSTAMLFAQKTHDTNRISLNGFHSEFEAALSLNRGDGFRPELNLGVFLVSALTNDRGCRTLLHDRDSLLPADNRRLASQRRDNTI